MGFITSGGVTPDDETLEQNAQGTLQIKDSWEVAQISIPDARAEIGIIELRANTTTTPIDHDSFISETFNDADGYNDYVNTGNTTATHESSGKYYRSANNSPVTDAHSQSTSTSSGQNAEGWVIKANEDIYITAVNFHSSQDGQGADSAKIYDSDGSTVLAQGTPSSNTWTLSEPLFVPSGETRAVAIDMTANGTQVKYENPSFPISDTNIDWTNGFLNGSTPYPHGWAVVSIESATISGDSVIEITLPSISGTVTDTMLIINENVDVNPVTYDLEDASANTDTGLSTDTKNALSNLSGNPTKLTLNLNKSAVKTAVLKIWKS